ncbi:TetR/AcrR family transcriptional regulator [Streptomyces synnematoformans]|uniref:TetR/AcrR family transcriptional regulator n=1 Tax=Streptomyces synnematoformans TaxID=415721 RepID=A0ABN1ZT14_9ACTN
MSPRTRGLGARHDERRREIADAVLAIVADQGLAAVSLTATAARAGVSPGGVQHYFPAKHDLIDAAFDRGNALSSERIRARAGEDLAAAEPRTVLTAVLTELIPYDAATTAHLRVRQSFNALALADAAVAERLRELYAGLHGDLAAALRRDRDAGRVRPGLDPDREAVALTATTEGLAYYVLIGAYDAGRARDLVLTAVDGVYC